MELVLPEASLDSARIDRNKFEKILKGGIAEIEKSGTGVVKIDRGRYYIAPREIGYLKKIGQFTAYTLTHPDEAVLPEYTQELASLGSLLSRCGRGAIDKLHFICPVCPDYGAGDSFYQQLRTGISPEAFGAINFVNILPDISKLGINTSASILVADTEDDIAEIIGRTVNGDVSLYATNCHRSVEQIALKVGGLSVKVTTFQDYFGDDFRKRQYEYEALLRQTRRSSNKVRSIVAEVGSSRVERHSQILGRLESEYELTIRYMAQYMALGSLVKQDKNQATILANYPTPNRKFFNAFTNVDPDLSLNISDKSIVPVMGTRVRR